MKNMDGTIHPDRRKPLARTSKASSESTENSRAMDLNSSEEPTEGAWQSNECSTDSRTSRA
jgi:hypothetical protein